MALFKVHPTRKALAEATQTNYWSIWRLVESGIAPTVRFTDGVRINKDFANRYAEKGLTAGEQQRYRDWNAAQRKAKQGAG